MRVLRELTTLIDAEVLRRELLAVDKKEVRENPSELLLEASRTTWLGLDRGVVHGKVFEESQKHQHEPIGAHCALERGVQTLQGQVLLEDDDERLEEGVQTDLLFHELGTLLSRLRVTFFCVSLTSVWVLHLAGSQDVVEDQVDFQLLVVVQFLLGQIVVVENSVFFVS